MQQKRKKDRKSWFNLCFLTEEKIREKFLCWFACNPPESPATEDVEAQNLFYDERSKICGTRGVRQGWRSSAQHAIQPLPSASPSWAGAGRTPPVCISWAPAASSPPCEPHSPSLREGIEGPDSAGHGGGRMTVRCRPRLQDSPHSSPPPSLLSARLVWASYPSPPPAWLSLLGDWAQYPRLFASASLFLPPIRSPESQPL